MRKRSYQFVVTVSALAACTPTGGNPRNPEPERTAATAETTAPEPVPLVATTEDAGNAPVDTGESVATAQPLRMSDFPKLMNPKDAAGRVIHRAWHGTGCYVELPFPPLKAGEERPPGTAPPTNAVACPKAMTVPAHEQCRGGTISQNGAGDACICFIMGNPPPLPKSVPCPGG